MHESRSMQKGFTIIEIMIVIGIIGVLMAALYPAFRGQQKRAKQGATKVQIKQVANALELYHEDLGEYPPVLKDLAQEPSDERKDRWRGPYIELKGLKDSFGKDYRYQVTEGAEQPYELMSYGAPEGKSAAKKDWIDVWKL